MSGKSSPSVSTSTYGVIVLRLAQSWWVEMPKYRNGSPKAVPVPAPTYWMSPARSDWLVQQFERMDSVHFGWGWLVAPSSMTDANPTYGSRGAGPWSAPAPAVAVW